MMNRWVLLVGYALLVCATQVLWVTFSPITTLAAASMHTGVGAVGDLTALFPIVYIVVAIPSGIWLDRGFKTALFIGAVLTGIGGISRVLFPTSYLWQLFMQLLLAAGQPFVINAMAAFARTYFPKDKRPAAISISSVALFAGIVIAMIASPLLSSGGLQLVELAEGLPATLIMVWVLAGLFGPFQAEVLQTKYSETGDLQTPVNHQRRPQGGSYVPPSQPPHVQAHSLTQNPSNSFSIRDSLAIVFRDKFIWLLCALLAIGLGIFDALNTWFEPILSEYGVMNASGNLLAVMIAAGILGAAVVPSFAAKHNVRKEVMIAAVGLAAWMFIAIIIWQSVVWMAVWMALDGFLLLAGFPIIVEWTETHVQHHLQGIAVGFVMLVSHLGGIVLIFLIQIGLRPPYLAMGILTAAALAGTWLTLSLPGKADKAVKTD